MPGSLTSVPTAAALYPLNPRCSSVNSAVSTCFILLLLLLLFLPLCYRGRGLGSANRQVNPGLSGDPLQQRQKAVKTPPMSFQIRAGVRKALLIRSASGNPSEQTCGIISKRHRSVQTRSDQFTPRESAQRATNRGSLRSVRGSLKRTGDQFPRGDL